MHENLANGSTVYRWKDFQFVVYERTGAPNLLVGLNNDMFNGWKTVTVQTAFGANVQLHDYSGHAGDLWTDGQGRATIGIPQNDNGQGYVCYSRAGLGKPNPVNRLATTQVFEGGADLDIGAAVGGESVMVGRIWCEAGVPVELRMESGGPHLAFSLHDFGGNAIALPNGKGRTQKRGWHTVQVSSSAVGAAPFKLAVTYTSTQTL
jgi:alpha-amylase